MSCDNCLATAVKAKLGRCPVCAGQTFVIGLVGWLVALIGIGCLFAGSVSRASHRLQRLS